jgi:uncharacterized protein (TIGR02145 family)
MLIINSKKYIALLLILTALISCKRDNPSKKLIKTTYKSVKINNQIWMAENLNVDRFRNGDTIPYARSETDWNLANKKKKPAFCYYQNDSINGKKYGKLYNWYAIIDKRGLAPKGWKLPSADDWFRLNEIFINSTDNINDLYSALNSKLGGICSANASFGNKDNNSFFWSTNEIDNNFALIFKVRGTLITPFQLEKGTGGSVRCLK